MTTTVVPRRVASHAKLAKDLVRAGRSRTTIPQQNPYVAQLAKDLLSREGAPRRAFDQVASLIADLAQRGQLEDAESVGLMYVAIARFEYQKAHGAAPSMSRAQAHMAEEEAEASVELAETAFAHEPTVGNYLRYLTASAAHIRARVQLDDVIRQELVKANAGEP